MNIIFWGTPDYSVESLKILLDSHHKISAVITQPDKKRSRGSKLLASPVKKVALAHDIPVFTPNKLQDNSNFIKSLKSFNSDVFVVIAYGKILSREILSIPRYGCWNAHASLLPRWRGAAPIHWAIFEGDSFTGVGIIKMDEGLDTGDILLEEKIRIKESDNLHTLSHNLSVLSSTLIYKSLEIIDKEPKSIKSRLLPQSLKDIEIKYARMIKKEDYKIDLNDSAENIIRKVKGLFPRSFIIHNGKILKILNVRLLTEIETNKIKKSYKEENINYIGKVLEIFKNEGVVIGTKTEPILIKEIKLEGKNISKENNLIQQLKLKKGENI